MLEYDAWFADVTGHQPHAWQRELTQQTDAVDRFLRIPTGLGKTAGAFGAWAWNRLVRGDERWPRRLVWTLPMRVLVEQVAETVAEFARRSATAAGHDVPAVHVLMGGTQPGEWHLAPERDAVLIGTQDMLLSRALNRGYAAPRARWPMEFALLHQDALWVLDEVQLMDVGLATTAQLQAFRRDLAATMPRPTRTWWMSATLQDHWFDLVDFAPHAEDVRNRRVCVSADARQGRLWESRKPVERRDVSKSAKDAAQEIADQVTRAHVESTPGPHGRITLLVLNTVQLAMLVHARLEKCDLPTNTTVHLAHSRFRPPERAGWRAEFLSRTACTPDADRIIVATQVVEAGVDMSATTLLTEMAPWASLVQRAGRAGRYGSDARIVIFDRHLTGKDCLPYDEEFLIAARGALDEVDDFGLRPLEEFEDRLAEDRSALASALYSFEPLHVLTRADFDDLFDTTPDLTGGDVDVSRFIRSGNVRDLSVGWFDGNGEEPPPRELQPTRDGLCQVPIGEARHWLFEGRTRPQAFVWDYLDGRWRAARSTHLRPGQVLLVPADAGGYDLVHGFTGAARAKGEPPVPITNATTTRIDDTFADLAQSFDDASAHPWKTIATHGAEVAEEVRAVAATLGIDEEATVLLELAARLHDWGKAHPVFQSAIGTADGTRPERDDLAKAPPAAWHRGRRVYCHHEPSGPRPGFRHELASALACFDLLHRRDASHGALLGPWRALIDSGIVETTAAPPPTEGSLADELHALSADAFDLVCYLVAAHHGKVRGRLHASAEDQEFPLLDGRTTGVGLPIRGVRDGDRIPPTVLATREADHAEAPVVDLHLDVAAIGLSGRYGRSWTERFEGLLRRHGPVHLAMLETILRVADVRASRRDSADPLLEGRSS